MLSAWLVSCAAYAVASGYYVPPQVDPWGPSKTPLHHMVDVANEFGLKVLNEHNFFNENNIAFSPYGLAGILVALYEGVDGDSSFQILESVRFPWNRDIMRVGFRDIHRTLKTYFIPVEGFLTGLALNNENVTFKESYTRILDFYGFDFKPKQITPLIPAIPEYDDDTSMTPPTTQMTTYPTTTAQTISENPTETTTFPPSTTVSPSTTAFTSLSSTIPISESTPTTEDSNVTSSADATSTSTSTTSTTVQDATSTTTTTTTTSSTTTTIVSSPEIETTTTTTAQTNPPTTTTTRRLTTTETTTQNQPETTEAITTTVIGNTNGITTLSQTTIVSMDTSTEAMENASETPLTSTEPIAAQSTADQDTDATMQSEMIFTNSTSQEGSTDAMTSNMEMTTSPAINMTESSTISVDTAAMTSTIQLTNTEAATADMTSLSETSSTDTLNSTETTIVSVTEVATTLEGSSTETSTVIEDTTTDSTDIPSTATTESQVEIISISTTPNSDDNTTSGSTIETLDRKKRSFRGISGIPPSVIHEDLVFHYPRAMRLENRAHSFRDETMFLANGLKRVDVSYMIYDTIMEHAYLPYLKASALKLPLDSDKYYLLVILPEYDFSLDSLIKRLAHLSNLRDIFSSLRPKYVHACVPSFMIKGHVSLTTDLQRLGIRDVFEPRQNDFTPMTSNKGVYVRNVEQAITVTIRKYSSTEPSERRYGYVPNQAPVQFGATYPFLFFVMDSTVNVALMAGKMMDPLNSRIL